MIEFLFVVLVPVVLALAAVGVMALWEDRETERTRVARQARQAEQRITDIGARAQAAIIDEALRRAHVRPTVIRPDDQYRPWDD